VQLVTEDENETYRSKKNLNL